MSEQSDVSDVDVEPPDQTPAEPVAQAEPIIEPTLAGSGDPAMQFVGDPPPLPEPVATPEALPLEPMKLRGPRDVLVSKEGVYMEPVMVTKEGVLIGPLNA